MATKKEDAAAEPAPEPKPEGFVRVVVGEGQIVRCAERKVHVRAGGVAVVPAHQYVESMGDLEGAEEDAKPRRRRGSRSDEEDGASDV